MNLLTQFKDYIRDSIHEIKKVTWPTKKHTINYSIVVVIMSLGIALFFGALDYVFNVILQGVIS